MNSWRPTETQKACNTYISKQKEYAHKYSISRLNPLVTQVSNFFAEMFQSGAGYGAVNITRSALSAFLGNAIGSHPHICSLVKGVSEEHIALPKYTDTWDVNSMLGCLSILLVTDELSSKQLTLHTVMLLSLLTAQRGHALHLLKVTDLKMYRNKSVIIPLTNSNTLGQKYTHNQLKY